MTPAQRIAELREHVKVNERLGADGIYLTRNDLASLLDIAEAAGPFIEDASAVRHTPEHDSDQWEACKRFDESRKPLESALAKLGADHA